jgi:hypothetical protein
MTKSEGFDIYSLELRTLRDLRGEMSFVLVCGAIALGVWQFLFYEVRLDQCGARGAIKLP